MRETLMKTFETPILNTHKIVFSHFDREYTVVSIDDESSRPEFQGTYEECALALKSKEFTE